MGEHKLGSVVRTLAKTLNVDGKWISNNSTRKSVVAKLKKAGQPRHKIIQITGHANECSLDDYDEVDEGERIGGLCPTKRKWASFSLGPTSLVATLKHPRQQEVQKSKSKKYRCIQSYQGKKKWNHQMVDSHHNHLISNKGEWNNCFIKKRPKIKHTKLKKKTPQKNSRVCLPYS